MLDIEYILFALERKSTWAKRSQKNTYQLLPMGTVYIVTTSAHVLFAIRRVAFV